ncbi:UNKNOWN [Stylonychia lemnae]|uniref:Uncharacterized protein n=1 Tax=Stylonychia lemnae TaxID=5949 RepID=A0A078A487_STYLE|nr:UNKNOWN [Stylonychia lemnae]|eukprot:CDW75569.1 UNKNOWN [Stylonychia lemnae]
MFHKTILTAAILLGACISIQISDVMQKQRSQLEWRQEATNTFNQSRWRCLCHSEYRIRNGSKEVLRLPLRYLIQYLVTT